MPNQITLFTISKLLARNFYIPSYQRGYRWTKQEVEDLLNDIYGFARKSKKTKELYCLQPVVVKPHIWKSDDGEELSGWEVVDGQQRLTTIYILLQYLSHTYLNGSSLKSAYGADIFTLDYETRSNTKEFLSRITEKNDENIDFYFISEAYQVIKAWFEGQPKPRFAQELVIKTLVMDEDEPIETNPAGTVQVIWYEINHGNAIDTFIRINLGKIALTSAELIKALFLQERDFKTDNQIAKLRRLEIAGEWDRIENKLQDEDFWWFINKNENTAPTRIEFILDLLCKVAKEEDEDLEKRIGNDRYATFRFFYEKIGKAVTFDQLRSEWDGIKDHFLLFEEWYSNPVWYHYIGFLIYFDEEITDLYKLTKDPGETKEGITGILEGQVKAQLKDVDWETDIKGDTYINLTYPADRNLIRKTLLLFNLIPIIIQSKAEKLIYKFPFQAFKRLFWDVEHVDSANSNTLKKKEAQVDWLTNAKADILDAAVISKIDDFVSGVSKKPFETLLAEITGSVGENPATGDLRAMKNNIGNLALLNSKVNRGYGNALFPTKRRIIIENDEKGDFIPMNTKHVFLKYYGHDASPKTRWTVDDMLIYREEIAKTLKGFLKDRPQSKKGADSEQI
ncbi:DUF262 domain-containing protein [Mucilaginibacter phyllosphaerae]